MKFLNNAVAVGLVLLSAQLAIAQKSNEVSKVWVADNGDGTYKNPVLHADYSDPDAIRVGDDYYMTASSLTVFLDYLFCILRIW